MELKNTPLPSGETLFYVGPDINKGPLPALFYFALSGLESLTLDPFNQPVQLLKDHKMRIFSLTLPDHGEGVDPTKAIEKWAKRVQNEEPFIDKLCDTIQEAVQYLKTTNSISETDGKLALGFAGLSRGGFIACHAASRLEDVNAILGYAPLTRISKAHDFIPIKEMNEARELDLDNLISKLQNKSVYFTIGNLDKRVGSRNASDIIFALADENHQAGIRSPDIYFDVHPSIGFKGHGTPHEAFKRGALWIAQKLGAQI